MVDDGKMTVIDSKLCLVSRKGSAALVLPFVNNTTPSVTRVRLICQLVTKLSNETRSITQTCLLHPFLIMLISTPQVSKRNVILD